MTNITYKHVDRRDDRYNDFDSESIDIIGYDRATKTLFVEFVDSAHVYGYPGVEESTYEMFLGAPSLNRFWREHIKGKFTSDKYDEMTIIALRDNVTPVDVTTATDVTGAAGLSRYAVDWYDDNNAAISGKPEYQADSEDDALRQFYAQLGEAKGFLGADIQPVVKAVTHYFD
jgi:hypothetical protein